MYLSLKWKAIGLALIILLTLSGFLIFMNSNHLTKLTEQQQQHTLNKLKNQLTGVLLQSYRQNLQLIDLLPAMRPPQTAQASSLTAILKKNWPTLQFNWGVERVTLYDASGNSLWKSDQLGSNTLKKLNTNPNWSLNCRIYCRQIITAPVIDEQGKSYFVQLEISTADLLIDFNKISNTDIAILSPAESADTQPNHYLPRWEKTIQLMTSPKLSHNIIRELESQVDFNQSLISSHQILHNENHYEVSVTPITSNGSTFFIFILNVSETHTLIKTAQRSLFFSAIAGILISCSIMLFSLWRPISRLRNQSEILPLMINENFSDALRKLHNNRSKHLLKDEIDNLNDTEEEVCRQLSDMRVDINKKTNRLHSMAMYDSLTELSNRRAFLQFIEIGLERENLKDDPFYLLFIDLDNFKRVNDSMGHNVGDELLKIVAQRLKSCVRSSDVIARLGGDEFCIILNKVKHSKNCSIVAENILETLRSPVNLHSNEFIISASIGIVTAPEDGRDSSDLLQNADIAMYRAKALGRNNYQHFDQSMTENIATKLSLESELRSALKNDEFVLFYQPQIDLETRHIFGYETLIRWQHPEKGLLFPDTFIGILEETGLIVEVGNWVIRESCRQIREWLDKGIPAPRLAINLSPRQLQEQDLGDNIVQAVQENQLSTNFIELEVTESLIMEDMELTQKQLSNLRDMGFTIAIDDFGTGHSSLSYLKSLPLDVLKIDRSFIQDLTSNNDDQEIVGAIIAMAHKLKLKVIAEGVETEEHQGLLLMHQCDYTQGYLYSRPVPAAQAEKMIIELHNKVAGTHLMDALCINS